MNFTGNSANETGGGVSGFNGFDLKVMGSTFSSNSAAQEGGALAAKVCALHSNNESCAHHRIS